MSGKKAADDDMIFVSNRKLCNTLLLFLADIKYYYFRLKPRVSTHNSTLVTLLKVNVIVFTRNFRFCWIMPPTAKCTSGSNAF